MTIKIGPTYNLPPVTDTAPQGASSRQTAATQSTTGVSEDKATVSAAGAQISALVGSADFDQAKVDAIRQAIREGRFSVNAEAIADRLIYEASALLGPRTH